MKILVLRAAMRVFSWITPPVAERIAPAVGFLLWYLSPRKRRVTRINLRAVYPDMTPAQRDEIARESTTQYVRGVFEAGMLWHWPIERIFSYFDKSAINDLYAAVRSGETGVIVAGGHSGAWELLGLYAQHHFDSAVLYKMARDPSFEEMLLEKRQRGGQTMIPATGAGLRKLFKLLKEGKTVAMAPDQEPTLGEGQFAPFYGVETLTGILLPRMARRTRAPVIFGTCERLKGGRYRVAAYKADDSVYSDDLRVAATAVNRGIEQCIEVNPGQYLWAYKRFRNRPDGDKSFYKK